jgi:hypothetical protein
MIVAVGACSLCFLSPNEIHRDRSVQNLRFSHPDALCRDGDASRTESGLQAHPLNSYLIRQAPLQRCG